MKPNRWLSTTSAIYWGDLSDFKCNNCQRNEGVNQKAISSDSDSITLWRLGKQRDRNERKYQILYNNGVCNKSFTLAGFQQIKACDTAHGVALLGGFDTLFSFVRYFLYRI